MKPLSLQYSVLGTDTLHELPIRIEEEINISWEFFTEKAEHYFRRWKLNLNIDCI